MKKRLIGTLLMGALFVSSTSVFVSCKDYDDDINNIVATKADKTALEEVKAALQTEINGLKTRLETVEGDITALTNNKADKFTEDGKTYNLVDVWTRLKPLLAKAAELETRIGAAEDAIDAINDLIGGQLANGKTYKQAVEEIYGRVEAVETGLGGALTRITTLEVTLNDPVTGLNAVYQDLQIQKQTIATYKAKVDAIEADYLTSADKTELINKINTLQTTLENKIATVKSELEGKIATAKSEAISTSKSYTDQEIVRVKNELTALINGVANDVDALESALDQLNVYVKSVLRGLVFKMQSFYEGIEATDITVLNYRMYTLPEANADVKEVRGYTGADFKGAPAADFAASDLNRKSHDYQAADNTKRYVHKDTTRVLTFFAKYYMNPSNAVVENDNNVNAVAFDRPYHSGLNSNGAAVGDTAIYTNEFNGLTTQYAANIVPKTWSCENGILTVEYDAKNPSAIRTIRNNGAVTMFATQVAVNKEGTDTLITSDFATLYKKEVKDIVISHTPSTATAGIHNGAPYGTHPKDSVNTHCGLCAYNHSNAATKAEYAAGLHLMQTVAEAAGMADPKTANQFNCQDSVNWNDSINLNKLVEVHYTTTDNIHTLLTENDAAYNGLKFKFELTGLYYGKNVTSESAHAAIQVNADGDYILRPQMPDSVFENGVWVGKAAPWDNNGVVKGVVGKQDLQTIGRTPLVRVSLLDKEDKVLDYGYIRIRITKPTEAGPAPVLPKTYTYNAGAMTASEAWCGTTSASPFQFKQKWIQMEYDIHHDLGLSQAEFEAYYTADLTGIGEFQQYYISANGYAQVVASPSVNEKLGTIAHKREAGDEETTVIEWDVTAAQLKAYLEHCGANVPASVTRLVKFSNPTHYKGLPDIYVAIVASPLTVAAPQVPVGTIVDWDGLKNANYWYAKDSHVERSGFTEIHTNVFGVEDQKEKQAKTFQQAIQATYVGNQIVKFDSASLSKFITIENKPYDGYANLSLALKFVLGENKEFKGYLNGIEKTFVCVLANEDRTLRAYDKADANKVLQDVAVLNYTPQVPVAGSTPTWYRDSINSVKVVYQHTDYAEAMLNYKAHNALADDVLTAYVTVKARYKKCPFEVNNGIINVRFLRPINVENKNATVEDAAVSQKQIIYLRDLVNLSDWREEPFKTNYWYYYNIKSIEVIGVNNEGFLSDNENVLTNMNQAVDSEPATSLKAVSNLVEFKYYKTAPGVANTYPGATSPTPNLAENTLPGQADYGCIVYTNLGSTVQKFKVRIPIKVVYEWGGAIAPATGAGAIFTTVDINVEKTHENARQK